MQSMGSQSVGHDLVTEQQQHIYKPGTMNENKSDNETIHNS